MAGAGRQSHLLNPEKLFAEAARDSTRCLLIRRSALAQRLALKVH